MRYYDSPTSRGGHPQDSLGQQILRVISNVGFAFFVLAVLTFTVIAVTYQPPDPLVQSAGELRDLLSGVHNATFKPDDTVLVTGEDVLPPLSSTSVEGALTIDDVKDAQVEEQGKNCTSADKVDCSDPGVTAAIELYNLHHYTRLLYFKYRQPVPVPDKAWACDVAWKYRSRRDRSSRLFRDYRRFTLKVLENCTFDVVTAGQWHSGLEAKPVRVSYVAPPPPPPPVDSNLDYNPDDGNPEEGTGGDGENRNGGGAPPNPDGAGTPPVDQGIENGVDTVQVTEISAPEVVDKSEFRNTKYLLYEVGTDSCKDINHFQWSFLCALGEARYLQRTFVMDLNFCLSSANNNGNGDEHNDFRMYFDLGHLKNSTPVVEQSSFWKDWNEWNTNNPDDQLQLKEFPDYHTTPQELREDSTTTLLYRKFSKDQPDNYWYRVCEGPAESVIERPWGLLWKAKTLVNIVEEICGKMEWNFYGLHVVRGDKAKNHDQYPNLDTDTQADKILDKLRDTLQIQEQSKIYIATNEANIDHFKILSDYYKIYMREQFSDLWSDDSEWYQTTKKILEHRDEDWKFPLIKFDPLMELMVDTEVLYRAQKKIETFSDLTNDCKNGINTC